MYLQQNLFEVSRNIDVWCQRTPDSKVHGANMRPIWGRQDPGGPHVGPMNFAIWDHSLTITWHPVLYVGHLQVKYQCITWDREVDAIPKKNTAYIYIGLSFLGPFY